MSSEIIKKHLDDLKKQKGFDSDFVDLLATANDANEDGRDTAAKILEVKILDEKRKHALVEVSDDQFSLAIGKKGQNVRLAAKLTGWKVDVRSPRENISHKEIDNEEATDEEEKL